MIDTFSIYNDLKDSFGDEPARKMTQVIRQIYEELSQSVRKEDFNELKSVVKELVEAQRGTEKRLDSLTVKVEELAEAQKRTEIRVEELAEAQRRTEARVEELAEAQKRTELKVEELAEAQRGTEKRLDSLTVKVEELAEAQRRTETRVEELAEAQKQTELEITKLSKRLRQTRQMVGGLSDSVGYGLEDRAIAVMPSLLKEKFGIESDNGFVRKYIILDGQEVELNMFGTGHKADEKWFVVGEAKAKLSQKDVDKFLRLLSRLRTSKFVEDQVFPIIVTYSTRPATQRYAEEKGINIIWSYELEKYR